jgi:Holliday junction resolvase RusA-like endonuclease
MRMVFGLHAPQDKRHGYPKRPDLDKLVRAVLDSLTGVCYEDDSQVIRLRASKVWASYTLIEVWQIERQTAQGQQTLFKGNA